MVLFATIITVYDLLARRQQRRQREHEQGRSA
jgi:preprotein translocase subunit YajC